MLKVEYDANNGISIPDGKVVKTVHDWIAVGHDLAVSTSSMLVIEALRLAIKNKTIAVNAIEISFEGKVLKHNSLGQIETWPVGFCDLHDRLLEKLIDWNDFE